ncbi:hypothetical protein RRF57_003473 [Xylaria bambusicola]|uniref:Uncharacterized protein n=1 Tax=Xylaria bambusicola TaxID=326684 RepID=A0AAN7UET9_9PEZI
MDLICGFKRDLGFADTNEAFKSSALAVVPVDTRRDFPKEPLQNNGASNEVFITSKWNHKMALSMGFTYVRIVFQIYVLFYTEFPSR